MRMFAAILFGAVLAGAARGEQLPEQRPMLRIEPGMHTATIWRVGVNSTCTMIATGSDDKTARLWSLPQERQGSAKLIRTFRLPIGDGYEGKVFAVTMSPDGKWVAAGGWNKPSDHWVYIFEAATGRMTTRLGVLANVVKHLTVSPDGTRLAATLGGGEGVRVWDTTTWNLVYEDKEYGGKDSYGAGFDGANKLFTAAFDGQVRRYSADGKLEAKAVTEGGKEPFAIAVHPMGGKIAIGFNDKPTVDVYDARVMKRLFAANTTGADKGSLDAVAWSTNGSTLYAAGNWGNNPQKVMIWPDEGRGRRTEAPLARDTILHLLPCRNNIAVAAHGPGFGLIGTGGETRVWQEGVTADMRNTQRDTPAVSVDGKLVRFGLGQDAADSVLFDLSAFQLSDADGGESLATPVMKGIDVTDWKNNYFPKLKGKPITLENYERSRSLAVSPDVSRFVLATDYRLRGYRADGTEMWKKAVPGAAWGANITPDGRLVVAAYGDGTIRWHRLSDGRELLALFVHAKDKRYVAWTPKGYYAASPGAEDLIGWNVNRDWENAPDFFPASRFREQFNRPDIVKRVLDDLDEEKAIVSANRLGGPKAPAEAIEKKLPPIITILSPGEDSFSSDSVTLRYSLRSPSGLAISEMTALVDGRPLPSGTMRGPANVSATADTEATMTLKGLPKRDITLSLVARSGSLESTPASIQLKFLGAPAQPSAAPAQAASTVSLYALVVGVGNFKEPKIDKLAWAGKDAREFAETLKRQEGRLYRKVEVRLLADEDADSGAILDGLTWLQRQVGQGDVGVVFLAGHGVTSPNGDYYYVPYNARIETVAGMTLPTRGSSVPDTEISHTLKQLAGNAVFFFDTCHSGKAAGVSFRGALDYNKLINEIAGSANAIVLSSSTGSELSMESAEWEHGAFTKALLEGMAGKGLHYNPGVVTIDELNLYVKERVKELTGGLQHPVDLKPKETRDIPFAMP